MITHDGSAVVSKDYGYFFKIENILYIEGGYKLEGLQRFKLFKIYTENHDGPIYLDPNSKFKREIYAALRLYCATYPKSHPFTIYTNGFVFNLFKISDATVRGRGSLIKRHLMFDKGLEVEVDDFMHLNLLDTLEEAAIRSSKKHIKKNILGFMDKE